jgi:hypothetical protein
MIYNWIGALLAVVGTASGKIYFKEDFNSAWEGRWQVPTDWKSQVLYILQ